MVARTACFGGNGSTATAWGNLPFRRIDVNMATISHILRLRWMAIASSLPGGVEMAMFTNLRIVCARRRP